MTKLADVLRRVEKNAGGLPSAAPAASEPSLDLRAAVQAAVRSAAEGVRRRLAEDSLLAEPSTPAPPPAVEIAMMQDQTIVMIDEAPAMQERPGLPVAQEAPSEPPPPLQAPLPAEAKPVPEPEEERQALEAALGIQAAKTPPHDTDELARMVELEVAKSEAALPRGAPAPWPAAPQKAPSAPAPLAPPHPPSPRPAAAAEEAPVSAAVRAVSFCWTALVRALTLIDRAVPTRLRACKPLFGRVGIALTGFAVAGLAVFAAMILRG